MAVKVEIAFENLIRDASIADEDQKIIINFLRLLESLNDYHAESVLKKLITFMKVHGSKLEQITDEQMHVIFENIIEGRKKREKII
jgi:hypothetical protein